jgi:hypothetical protein
MADKNFIVKNGLEVGGQEVVSSSGVVTSAALGGQTLASTDSPTFNNLTLTNDIAVGGDLNLTGDLNITGDVNSLSVTDLDVTDQTITLGAGQVESASGGSGIIIDGSSASILWDETNTSWDFNESVEIAAGKNIRVNTVNDVGNTANIIYRSSTNTIVGNNASALVVQDGGNVGIGTSSPAAKLNVYTDAGRDFRVDHGTANRTILSTDRGMIVKAGGGYSLELNTGSDGGSILFQDNGVTHSQFNASGNLALGTTTHFGTGGAAKLSVAGILSIGASNADLSYIRRQSAGNYAWQTYDNNNTGSIQLQPYGGNVGIGTDSPTELLDVNNTSNSHRVAIFRQNNASYNTDIALYHTSSSSDSTLITKRTNGDLWLYQSTAKNIAFFTTSSERMRIDSSGNVGIGTDSPNAKLEIKGASSTNYLQFNNSSDSELFRIDSNFNWAWGTTTPTQAFDMRDNSGNALFSVDRANGKVGIGTNTPDSNLHVLGTNPVIRVSDDGSTGYSTLELRQQNTATEGTELIYDSTTGHTHLNTVFGADLKIATNTGSFGTTNTNTRLTVKSDGEIHVGKSGVSTDRIEFVGNTNISAPSTSNHDLGTRLSLYDANTTSWYAIGIESNHMWFNADGGIFKFYQQAVQKIHFDGTNPMPVVRVGPSATNAMTLGSVTSVFPYSGINMIVATPGAALTVHNGTNSAGTWVNLHSSLSDYLRGTATFSTINTSQQANIIVYLNVATKVYLARQPNWNSVSTTGWTQISNDSTVISDNESHNVYVRYLPAGTHSLDNDSALYFFEAPIGP